MKLSWNEDKRNRRKSSGPSTNHSFLFIPFFENGRNEEKKIVAAIRCMKGINQSFMKWKLIGDQAAGASLMELGLVCVCGIGWVMGGGTANGSAQRSKPNNKPNNPFKQSKRERALFSWRLFMKLAEWTKRKERTSGAPTAGRQVHSFLQLLLAGKHSIMITR